MTHRLTTNYAKNYCNRTFIVKVIVENVVTCFLGHGVHSLRRIISTESLDSIWSIDDNEKHKNMFLNFYKKNIKNVFYIYDLVQSSISKFHHRLRQVDSTAVCIGGYFLLRLQACCEDNCCNAHFKHINTT